MRPKRVARVPKPGLPHLCNARSCLEHAGYALAIFADPGLEDTPSREEVFVNRNIGAEPSQGKAVAGVGDFPRSALTATALPFPVTFWVYR
jgi:hypothetical protein